MSATLHVLQAPMILLITVLLFVTGFIMDLTGLPPQHPLRIHLEALRGRLASFQEGSRITTRAT